MGNAILNVEEWAPVYDPYDLWASNLGVRIRRSYYAGSYLGKVAAVGVGLTDWLVPTLGRKIFRSKPLTYPITVAQTILYRAALETLTIADGQKQLDVLRAIAVDPTGRSGWAWGLRFPWMSKNGRYGPDVPFVTHTPYVMEALLILAGIGELRREAMELFHGTWDFLESLKVMSESSEALALSYAPTKEPRIVVNANTYAAFAYALHATHGRPEVAGIARDKAIRLLRWTIRQQHKGGAWFYYADCEPGNFIDCFHSCFVVKNLLKAVHFLPEALDEVAPAINAGWRFIREHFYDKSQSMCQRFARRAQRDPFRWDLYDQAEYLGLLVDFGLLDEAGTFSTQVEARFRKGENSYCRIDIFGRRWGKNFSRWGLVPFLSHKARLDNKLKAVT